MLIPIINGCKKRENHKEDKMNRVIRVLDDIKTRVAQVNPDLSSKINDAVFDMGSNIPMETEDSTIDTGVNPKIESFARPRPNVSVVSDDGTVHSFAVEIKAKHNGPIPDTQLMSKILQSIESHSDTAKEFAAGDDPESNSFEVVSFKYERRDDKKKQ
jgi:hypothetical protein